MSCSPYFMLFSQIVGFCVKMPSVDTAGNKHIVCHYDTLCH